MFVEVIDCMGKRTYEPLFWSLNSMKPTFTPCESFAVSVNIAHSSASPCFMFGLPVAGMPAETHVESRAPLQPLLFLAQFDVLSTMKSTFGTCAGILGFVVKRSVS